MRPKISVLLATNRINDKCFKYMQKAVDGLPELKFGTFTDEFQDLAIKRLDNIKHFLEPTLRSLEAQKFTDFEFVISHRYPDDVVEILKGWNFPIVMVKEKHSIWHDLGEQYHTVANNKNTAFIESKGDLIYHIDDLTFFNKYLLKEAWDLYEKGHYMTGRTVRCITYDKDNYPHPRRLILGPNKISVENNKWIGQIKQLTPDINHPKISMATFWTCSASVSADDLLRINGYDELYDGSLAGIDMDAGMRLARTSKFSRVASDNYLYEIDDPTPKNMVRDDVMMRNLMRVSHNRANSWKPNTTQIRRYERWHERKLGELDSNWNKFMNVPLYDIRRIV